LFETTFAVRADEIVPRFGGRLFFCTITHAIFQVALEQCFGHRFSAFRAAGVFGHFLFAQHHAVEVSVPAKGLVLGERFAASFAQVIFRRPDARRFFWSAS